MPPSVERQRTVIARNVALLRQAEDLLAAVSDQVYADSPPGCAPHRVGGHMRHILEFYECFLEGIAVSYIDYDARRRDATVETDRAAALDRVRWVIQQLEDCTKLLTDGNVFVRIEDASNLALTDAYVESSAARELAVLSSHTIHHFALIAVTLQQHGVPVDPGFGVAPSTLTWRQTVSFAVTIGA